MGSTMQSTGWRGTWLLLGTLALAACGGAPESLEEDAQEGTVSAMHGPGGKPSPDPRWAVPTFATGTAMATDGNQFLVVWRDVLRPTEMFAARVSKQGRLLDPDSIPLNPAPAVSAGAPAVAFDGRQFLVVWHGESSLVLVRVDRDGTVDGPPRPLVANTGNPSRSGIACTWRKCLVAWAESPDPRGVRGVLVRTHDSGINTRELTLSSGLADTSFGVPVAFSDNRFLVAWSDSRLGTPKVFASRVTCDGTVLDPEGFLLSDTPGAQTFVDAVGTKQGFLVAWSDTRNGTGDIFGTRVKSHGAVPNRASFPLSTGPDEDFFPALAFDGQRVLATWSRRSPDRYSVRGNLVRADGTGASPDGFLLSDDEFVRELDQDVAFTDGKYFLAYGAAPTTDEPPFQVILGTRVKKDGTRVDDPAIRISHSRSVEGATLAPRASTAR